MNHRFQTLDGMRGVAALAVAMMHCQMFLSPLVLTRATLAVDLFYGLSGLVIAHAYGGRLTAGLGWARFMVLRLIRLYPLYLLGTLAGIFLYMVGTAMGRDEGVSAVAVLLDAGLALLMLPAAATIEPRDFLQPFNMPAWSLYYELLVNLMLALVWRRLTNPLLIAIILASGAALIATVLSIGHSDLGSTWPTFWAGLPRAIFSFFLGVGLARLPRPAPVEFAWAWTLPLLMVPALIVGRSLGPVFELACILIFFPALIYLGAIVELKPSPFTRACTVLGQASFALYALHAPLLQVALALSRKANVVPEAVAPLAGFCLLLVVTLIALIADTRFDPPARRWLSRMAFDRTRATA